MISFLQKHWRLAFSLLLLLIGLGVDYVSSIVIPDTIRLAWYLMAYIPVAVPVLRRALTLMKSGEIFTEFTLMGIATLGALLIGEYPEAVAVMLFYEIGELFQHQSADRARENIRALLDVRSETAHLVKGESIETVHPKAVSTGEVIRVKPGERVPLDGELLAEEAFFDTSALTGESRPSRFRQDETVRAGMINLNRVIDVRVTSSFDNSSISRILELVQNASSRKAKTELFIRKFARYYTPAVVLLATLLVIVPAFFVASYQFQEWLYRGLVFLVISCPCALLISIPLGYFGGIGAASANGILVKGGNYLDALKSVDTVVFDKTGTLTRGVFEVQEVQSINGREDLLAIVHAVEQHSTHPIARAISSYVDSREAAYPLNGVTAGEARVSSEVDEAKIQEAVTGENLREYQVSGQREIPGYGIIAEVDEEQVLVGSRNHLEKEGVAVSDSPADGSHTMVYVAIGGVYEGRFLIADELKEDAGQAVSELRRLGVRRLAMLSGDSEAAAQGVGKQLKLDQVDGGLLPEEKVERLEDLKRSAEGTVVYVGDGINDAPVLALSDVGIAMGAMGSDAAIETADVVVQTDQPSKIATAIRVARSTRNVVWQNITLAMGVKTLFLILGAWGVASMWEAVFADVGVALLAILNAVRIQKIDFSTEGGGEKRPVSEPQRDFSQAPSAGHSDPVPS